MCVCVARAASETCVCSSLRTYYLSPDIEAALDQLLTLHLVALKEGNVRAAFHRQS